MAQFTVYRNQDPASRKRVPLLLDVQTDLLSELATRTVLPLYPAAALKGRMPRTLMPVLRIDGKSYVAATPEIAGIPRKALGPAVADLSGYRGEIVAAIDLLITGI